MKPMPAWERASLPSARGRHARNAVAKSPLLNADNPVRNSSSGEAATAGQTAPMSAATARKDGIGFTGFSRFDVQDSAQLRFRPLPCWSPPVAASDRGTSPGKRGKQGEGAEERCL